MTTGFRPATDYEAHVDPLHRNTWPIRLTGDETVIGHLTEHITVALDGTALQITRWSWAFEDAEANALRVPADARSSGGHRTWQGALDAFANTHQLAVALREANWNASAELPRRGE